MAAEIITKEDLQEFREQLLQDIKQLLGAQLNEPKKLLKSYQVKNMLKISSGTLQTLRTNGTLPYKKVGGIIYYQYEDLLKLTGQFK
ncbi:MAG: helix-turn-helix domain-containing protein [Daejeonella sp.]|nr:helix-turn-helix domain-containing protein [Daejeonella sp.]